MASSEARILASNIAVVANQPAVNWPGGFATLNIIAGTYPTTCFLQMLGPDNTTWINMAPATVVTAATTISANGSYGYNLPAGQYRLGMSGGTVAGLYASISHVRFIE